MPERVINGIQLVAQADAKLHAKADSLLHWHMRWGCTFDSMDVEAEYGNLMEEYSYEDLEIRAGEYVTSCMKDAQHD